MRSRRKLLLNPTDTKMKKDNNKTTIAISDKLWKKLNDLRENSKETFEDVIKRLIKK